MTTKIEAAVEQVTDLMDKVTDPDLMTKAEAVEFYDTIKDHSVMWSQTITREMDD